MTTLQQCTLVAALAGLMASAAYGPASADTLAPDSLHIVEVEQPAGIEPARYVETWPALTPYVERLRAGDRAAVAAELRGWASSAPTADGAWNLLAQIEREDGRLDSAGASIARATAMDPKQPLHHFQQALINDARLSRVHGLLDKREWRRRTRDAYQRAFDLDPKSATYRRSLVYSFAQAPGIASGDRRRALLLTQEALDSGQWEFYLARADVQRARGYTDSAFVDYDRAMGLGLFRLDSFLAAGQLALKKKDPLRAKPYFEWAARCRPENARVHEGLGDCYAAMKDARAAAEYEAAVRADPNSPARSKLNKVRRS